MSAAQVGGDLTRRMRGPVLRYLDITIPKRFGGVCPVPEWGEGPFPLVWRQALEQRGGSNLRGPPSVAELLELFPRVSQLMR